MSSHEFKTLLVNVLTFTDEAVQVIVYEDEAEEETVWIPLSCLEDPTVIEELDEEGNCEVRVKRWFLKKSDIPYNSDED